MSSRPRKSSEGMSLTTGSVKLRSSAVGQESQVSSICLLKDMRKAASCG